MTDLIPPLVSDGHILAEVNGCLGLITLNRPQALNALSLAMIRDMTALLRHWAASPQIQAVAVLGAGREGKPPAFCAGGDIRFFHQAAHAGDPALGDFFTEEYRLNHLIHNYPKPYIALMDGIVMGGGMGISQGSKLRVLSERSALAMPETGIGLFPDVGGGWFLAQCPGAVGEWLALTGETIAAGDAIEWGLGDVFVLAEHWPALIEDLRHVAPSPAPSTSWPPSWSASTSRRPSDPRAVVRSHRPPLRPANAGGHLGLAAQAPTTTGLGARHEALLKRSPTDDGRHAGTAAPGSPAEPRGRPAPGARPRAPRLPPARRGT